MIKKYANPLVFLAALVLGAGTVSFVRYWRATHAPPPDLIGLRLAELRKFGPLTTLVLDSSEPGAPEDATAARAPEPKPRAVAPVLDPKSPRKLAPNVAHLHTGPQRGSLEAESGSGAGTSALYDPSPEHLNVPQGVYDSARVATENLIKVKDGSMGYNGRMYATTLTPSSVEVALPFVVEDVGQPRMSIVLTDVQVGGKPFVDASLPVTPELVGEERTVRYQRGTVQEDYAMRPDAIEQLFRFTTLPPDRGSISVTIAIQTNLEGPPDGTVAKTLAFGGKKPLLTIDHALAFDSAGRSLELDLTYAAGKVTMTIPAEWVADATLPIMLDPLIGAPITVDGAVNNSFQVIDHYSDVAYNSTSNEWFVVWSEPHGASAFDDDLFGQRLSATGALVGAPIAIDTRTIGAYEMTVAYAAIPNRYLVAWRTDPADNGSFYDGRIDARIVNANGTFATSIFTTGDFPELDMYPAAASDRTNFYVVWQHIPSAGIDRNIYGRFVTNAGALGAFAHPDTDTQASQNPRLSYSAAGNSYMIVWRKSPGGNWSLYGRLLSAASQTFLTSGFIIEGATGVTSPDVSAGNSRFLITWTNAATFGVVGRINFSATAAALSSPMFTIRSGPNQAIFPKAAFSTKSNEWYIAYTDAVVANELAGSKVTYDGALDGQERLTYNSVAESCSSIAWNSATDEMLIVFRQGNSPYTIQAQRVGFPATQIYALINPPQVTQLLRYDRGTITQIPLDASPLIQGASANYLGFVMPADRGWRFEAYNPATGGIVRQVDNLNVTMVRGNMSAVGDSVILQGNSAFFMGNRFGVGTPPVMIRVDVPTGAATVFDLPVKATGAGPIFDAFTRVGTYYWPDDLNARPVTLIHPTTGAATDLVVRQPAPATGFCFYLPSVGTFATEEYLSSAGRFVQHSNAALSPLATPVVHQLSTITRLAVPGVYQGRPAILYGEGLSTGDGFNALVIYDPQTRTQLLRKVLGFTAGHMKASSDFSAVILTDKTTPGIVRYTPGGNPDIVRLVNLVNFTYPTVILKAP